MTTTSVTGSGGIEVGGGAGVEFVHGGGYVDADVVVEWDLDGDGDFDLPEEDITATVLDGESAGGRDFASQLTGRAGPGQFRLTLNNEDSRYSRFNASSPLNTPPLSTSQGGRIRLRTATAANPDPQLLARDRFRGSGSLGLAEVGGAWTGQTAAKFVRQQDSTGRTLAVHDGPKAARAIATVDVGVDDYYAQVRVRHSDDTSTAGTVYRYVDASNWGAVLVVGSTGLSMTLDLVRMVAGVLTVDDSVAIERRTDMTVGVLVDGSAATGYLEGVPVLTGTAFNGASNKVGLVATWATQRAVSFDEFYVWESIGGVAEGVLWTGKVVSVTPRRGAPGDPGTVELLAEGPLYDAARVDIDPPRNTALTASMSTGLLVGATLSAAALLHPPGPIDAGDVTTGAVGLDPDSKALDVLRLAEAAELGFVYETPEGRVGFDARSARSGGTPVVTFSDEAGAQFGYQSIELGDWRREVYNRVKARLSPRTPVLLNIFGTQANNAGGVDTNVSFLMPNASPNNAEVGDLVIVVIASTVATLGVEWLTPPGWKNYRDAKDHGAALRIYGKVLDEGDIGSTVLFYDDVTTGGAWINRILLIKRDTWFGDIDTGVVVTEPHSLGPPNTMAAAQLGENSPPAVFPSWGPAPSLFIAFRAGFTSSTGGVVTPTDENDELPHGYRAMNSEFADAVKGVAYDLAIQNGTRRDCVQVEAPSQFASGSGKFDAFNYVETVTIAVRGWAGDPPEAVGGAVVQVDDVDSQDRFDAILTHDNPAELFADEVDATAYGEAVLVRHSGERPIFTLTFPATISAAYRAQAFRRRVSDLVYLVADGDAGQGVRGAYYVEHVTHRISDAGKVWDVTWELSPA